MINLRLTLTSALKCSNDCTVNGTLLFSVMLLVMRKRFE